MIRGMGPSFLNGMRAAGSNPGMWLSLNPDEFADELRRAGWGENAIANEVGMLLAYIAQFPVAKAPPPVEIEPERAKESTGLRAVLGMRMRKQKAKEELGVEDGD